MHRHAMTSRQTKDIKIKILQLNAGKRIRVDQPLKKKITSEGIDIVALQEPYTYDRVNNIKNTFAEVVTMDNDLKPSAIIATTNSRVNITRLTQFTTNNLAAAKVTKGSMSFILVSIYCRSENNRTPITDDINQLQTIVSHADTRNEPLVICGDFNASSHEWGSRTWDARGRDLASWAHSNGLYILNNEGIDTYQHEDGLRTSVIDLTIANDRAMEHVTDSTVDTRDDIPSDHRPLIFEYKATIVEESATRYEKYNLDRADWDKYRNTLSQKVDRLSRLIIDNKDSVENFAVRVVRSITESADTSIPMKRRSTKYKHFCSDPYVEELLREKKRLWGVFRRANKDHERKRAQAYEASKIYREAAQKSRSESFQRFITETADKNLWSLRPVAEKASNDWTTAFKTIQKEDDSHTADTEETLEYLMERFFPDNRHQMTESDEQIKADCEIPPNTRDDTPFTEIEVMRVVKKMANRKAPGEDKVVAEMIKKASDLLAPTLTKLANGCLQFGYFPVLFKSALVRFIKKPGAKPDARHKAFRPICLGSVVAKIIDSLFTQRLQWHLYKYDHISHQQFGFAPGKSTTDALDDAIDFMREKKKKNRVIVVSIDVQGAFDSARWHHILNELKSKEVPKNIYRYYKSYLSDRQIKATIGDTSVMKTQTQGVLQGSSSGPMLWNTLYDSVVRSDIGMHCHLTAYADDLLLIGYYDMKDLTDTAEQIVNKALSELTHNAGQLGITFNPSKSKVLRLNRRAGANIVLNGEVVPEVGPEGTLTYLGVELDATLAFTTHRTKTINKALAKLTQYRNICKKTWGIGSSGMKTILKAIIEPTLFYAAPALAKQMSLNRWCEMITKVYRQAMIAITKCFSKVSNEALFAMTGVLPPKIRLQEIVTNHYIRTGVVRVPELSLIPVEDYLKIIRPVPYKNSLHPSIENNRPLMITPEQTEAISESLETLTLEVMAVAKKRAKEATLEAHQQRWQNPQEKTGRHTFALCPDLRHPTIELKDYNHLNTQFITGHGNFRSHLHRFKLKDSPNCLVCGVEDTPEHVAFECRRFSAERQTSGITAEDRPLSAVFANKDKKKKLFAFIEAIAEEWCWKSYQEYYDRQNQNRRPQPGPSGVQSNPTQRH